MAIVVLVVIALVVLLRYGVFGDVWRGRVSRSLRPALVVGAIGFAAGFIGPIIFTPGANQGPLLGIFITGPLGFLLGLVWGIVREWKRSGSTGNVA